MPTDNRMLVQLTVAELYDIIDERVASALGAQRPCETPGIGPMVWGIKSLANFLGCSVPHASVIVQSGKYADAIIHPEGSRRVAFFPEKLKQLLRANAQ